MNIFQYINIPLFIISLGIGLFYVYLTSPLPDVIFVYPTPDNIDKILYKDKSGLCYGFEKHKVKCPKNKMLIRKYPVHQKK